MKTCDFPGCNQKIKPYYSYCYEHRLTEHEDFCRIHGKTLFVGNKCLKCEQMMVPTYNVYKRGNQYYNFYGRPLPKYKNIDYERLIRFERSYQNQFVSNITEGPGIYGLFVRDKRNKKGIGKCLYIGQSYNVKARIKQHRDCFKIAKQHLNGIKLHKKRIYLSTVEFKVEYKYYKMAKQYNMSRLKFVKLVSLPFNDKELLTYFEQAMMNCYDPQFNTFAARPRKREGR